MELYDNFLKPVKIISYIIYARLSKEEKGKSKEEQSLSIKNQIEMCQKFIEEEKNIYSNCQFIEVAILNDDGISGTTFDREDFNKLILLIEKKKVNMVITKDLSRLGRDHIKTDNYLEKWFPEHNVRYVSLLENIDTYQECVSNEIAPIINWCNENFARQTSKKIKRTFKNYQIEGKWTGGEPPLGYRIDPYNKYHFIIDKKEKEIVEKIFKLAKENYSISCISEILNNENIPIPSFWKGNYRKINLGLWSVNTIKNILQNEVYLGYMVQGKTTRLNYKSKKIVNIPKDQWQIIPNMHEPIIDKETFDTVQLMLKSNKNKTFKTYDYLLKGMIKCRECHHSIGIQHYYNRSKNYTVCNFYRKYGIRQKGCTAHRFNYETVEEEVLKNIKEDCFRYLDQDYLEKFLIQQDFAYESKNKLKKELDKRNKEIAKLNRQLEIIYEDRLNGIIDSLQYHHISNIKLQRIEDEKKKIKEIKNDLNEMEIQKNYKKIVKDFLTLKNPNKLMIVNLIDTIYLSEDGVINIYYKIKKS